jgi:hypothetical protein
LQHTVLVGTELRTDASINNEYATRTAILRFCEGIGDDNPLWTQADYSEKTQHGSLIAPPSFIFACLAGVQVGWPRPWRWLPMSTPRSPSTRTSASAFQGFDGPNDSKTKPER